MPDEEGVVASVSRRSLALEGGRTYKLTDKLVAFSTYNRHTISVLGTKGDYVHLGLDGDTVVWVGRIGKVIDNAAQPVVIYQGQLRKIDGARLEFADGTVLRLADNLDLTDALGPGVSEVAIDPHAGPRARESRCRPSRAPQPPPVRADGTPTRRCERLGPCVPFE